MSFCKLKRTSTPGLYKCKVCGKVLPDLNTEPPERVFFPCSKAKLEPPLPPVRDQLYNFGKAIARFAANPKTVSKEQFIQRTEICNQCVWRRKNRCSICGCKLSGLINKVKLKTEKCPLGKWPHANSMTNLLLFKGNNYTGVDLYNSFLGASCFFIGGGPSLRSLEKADLNALSSRGIFTVAVNNIAAKFIKPNIWVSVDAPASFSDIIFKDPTIMKLVASENYAKNFIDTHNGKKEASKLRVCDCPNTFMFERNKEFNAETYLTEPTVNWGSHGDIVDSLGNKGGRSVMMAAIRLIHHLGFRQVYLLGCDFHMNPNSPYAFEQSKRPDGCKSNNDTYEITNKRFQQLRPKFEREKFIIKNCTPDSKLTAFDYLPLSQALTKATEHLPKKIDLSNMYG